MRKDDRSRDDAKLEDSSTWPDAPVFFCSAPSMSEPHNEPENARSCLPLDEVIPFETDLFHGKILFRVKGVPPDDKAKRELHDAYFANRKRLYQVVVQGQFLRDDMTFADLFIGARYDQPFDGIPMRQSRLMRSIQSFIQRLNPGMLFDIAADKPRVMAPMGTCQRLRVDKPGDAPDILQCARGIEENTALMFQNQNGEKPFSYSKDRRKRMADPHCSAKFAVDPSLVYTYEIYDHTIDFCHYRQHFGGFVKVDLANKLNGQPLTLTALVVPRKKDRNKNSGSDGENPYEEEEVVYDFQVWHERLAEKVCRNGSFPAVASDKGNDDDDTSDESLDDS